jgi:hypothetical protein
MPAYPWPIGDASGYSPRQDAELLLVLDYRVTERTSYVLANPDREGGGDNTNTSHPLNSYTLRL